MTIDERIVRLRMDGEGFERGARNASRSMLALQKALNMDNTQASLNRMQTTMNNMDFGSMDYKLGKIANSFTMLGVTAQNVMNRISNMAISAASNLVRSFTIEPVIAGFKEWELQMNSIQTIWSNTKRKGTTLDDVSAALDELNHYADLTIYNFSEMTRNIGTFTAAGVGLEESVRGIKGIANLAAISGSSSQQASTAMYQLSQALATGTVKLMDWNSVVNAGMGGDLFQQQLMQTARVHGVAVDAMIAKNGSFRESLHEGWLTSEILLETLGQFAGEFNEEQLKSMGYTDEQIKQIIELGKDATDAATKVKTFTQLMDTLKEAAGSGWMESWRTIFGDFDEAREMFTGLSNYFSEFINQSSQARNNVLTLWKKMGGRDAGIDIVVNSWTALMNIVKAVRDGLEPLIPMINGRQIAMGMKEFAKFTESLTHNEEVAKKVTIAVRGIADVVKLVVDVVKVAISIAGRLVIALAPLAMALLDIAAKLGETLSGFANGARKVSAFIDVFAIAQAVLTKIIPVVEGVGSAVSKAFSLGGGALSAFIDLLGRLASSGLGLLLPNIAGVFSEIGASVSKESSGLSQAIQNGIDSIWNALKGFGKIVNDILRPVGKALSDFLGYWTVTDFATVFNPVLMLTLFGSLRGAISDVIQPLITSVTRFGDFFKDINNVLKEVKNTLVAYQVELKAEAIQHIAIAVGILAAAVLALSLVDPVKLTGGLAGMTVLLAEMLGMMAAIDKVGLSTGWLGLQKMVLLFNGLAVAVLLLSGSVLALSLLDWEGLAKGLIGVAGLLAMLVAAMKGFSMIEAKIHSSALFMIELGVAINLLVMAVKGLARIGWEEMAKGLTGVGVLLAELVAFMKFADPSGLGFLSGAGLLMLAGSLKIMQTAVSGFASMDLGAMIQGLTAIGVLLTEIGVFAKFGTGGLDFAVTAVGLNAVAVSMLIFARALQEVGSLSLKELAIGLAGFAGVLASTVIAFRAMPKSFALDALGLTAVAIAMDGMAKALIRFGSMSPQQLATGLIALGGSLAILAVGLRAISGTISGAVALAAVSAGLALFVPELIALSTIPIPGLIVALGALAGTFAIFGIAGAALGPVVPIILALSAAIGIFGAGVALAGAGTMMFATAMTQLAVSGKTGADGFMAAMTSILSGLPLLAGQISGVIKLIARVIVLSSPVIIGAIESVILDLLAAIVRLSPKITEAGFQVLVDLLKGFAEAAPEINEYGYTILLEFLKGIRDNIQEVVEVAIDIINKFFDGLNEKMPELVDKGFETMVVFLDSCSDAIDEHGDEVIQAFFRLGGSLVSGLVSGVSNGFAAFGQKIKDLGISAINTFAKTTDSHSPSRKFIEQAGYIISGLCKGLDDGKDEVGEASTGLANNLLASFRRELKIHSPSIVMNEQGHYIVQGVAEGIKEDTSAEDAMKQKAQNIANAFKTELDKLDLGTTTASLQYQLWEAVSNLALTKKGEDLTDAEALAYTMEANRQELAYLTTQLQNQNTAVALAYDKYNEIVKYAGASSTEAQEAWNAYLQAQIDYANTARQVEEINREQAEYQTAAAESIRAQARAYDEYIMRYSDLIGKGFTKEEIEAAAREATGFDPRTITTDLDTYVTQAVSKGMETVQTAYSAGAASALGGAVVDQFSTYGTTYAQAIGTAMTNETPNVSESAVQMVTESANAIKDKEKAWGDAALVLINAFVNTITKNIQRVAQEAAAMAVEAYNAAVSAIGGEGMNTAINDISTVGDGWSINPTITPVVDLSDVERKQKQIENSFAKANVSISATASNAGKYTSLNGSREHPSERTVTETKVVNQNFTQNNYSPKALSRTEIYRQTKNQFSTLKGAEA